MATLADAFGREDRTQVTFSEFYRLMKESAKAELLMNSINCNVPHRYIREMATGKSEAPGQKAELHPGRIGQAIPPAGWEASD